MSVPLIFDVETGPIDLDTLKSIADPFDPSTLGKHPGQFDPSSVKLGNTKDQAKINEKIEASRIKHEALVAEYEEKLANGEDQHWQDVLEKAALSALTGQVLAIGYLGNAIAIDGVSDSRTEEQVLLAFWKKFSDCQANGRKMIGFNLAEFDIPFLVQRSWILGIEIPKSVVRERLHNHQSRYLDNTFIDLRMIWKGPSWQSKGSLDSICRACGIGSKPSNVNGGQFAELYRGSPESWQMAIDYLHNDLQMTFALAQRMGVA